MKIPTVKLHPHSEKFLKLGHPWITEDDYTKRFPKESPFLIGVNSHGHNIAMLINDPEHKKIKARLWSQTTFAFKDLNSFLNDLEDRITKSILKRSMPSILERENYYLVFGEADLLPGLFIIKFNNVLLIQFYSFFWKNYSERVTHFIKRYFQIQDHDIWIQYRGISAQDQRPAQCLAKEANNIITIKEFGIKYELNMSESYDQWIYTDMAAIRFELKKYFEEAKSVLNLYSYTGAYSLYALKLGAKTVTSVDLSSKYLAVCEKNIALNLDLDPSFHISLCTSVDRALVQFKTENKTFDLIIVDPPSSSSDGQKRSFALNKYETQLFDFDKILNKNGICIVFLNTHHISSDKFEKEIKQIITAKQLNLKIEKRLSLRDDCPILKNFSEGNYLKGLVLRKL